MKLLFDRPLLLRGLVLKNPERFQVAPGIDDVLDGFGAERADQFVLKVRDEHEEAKGCEVRGAEIGAEPCTFEATPKVSFLRDVAQAGQPDVKPVRAEEPQEAPNARRPAERHETGPFCGEIPATALSQGLEGDLVADPFDDGRTEVLHFLHAYSFAATTICLPGGEGDRRRRRGGHDVEAPARPRIPGQTGAWITKISSRCSSGRTPRPCRWLVHSILASAITSSFSSQGGPAASRDRAARVDAVSVLVHGEGHADERFQGAREVGV